MILVGNGPSWYWSQLIVVLGGSGPDVLQVVVLVGSGPDVLQVVVLVDSGQ